MFLLHRRQKDKHKSAVGGRNLFLPFENIMRKKLRSTNWRGKKRKALLNETDIFVYIYMNISKVLHMTDDI